LIDIGKNTIVHYYIDNIFIKIDSKDILIHMIPTEMILFDLYIDIDNELLKEMIGII
jgi:hypothetical protein